MCSASLLDFNVNAPPIHTSRNPINASPPVGAAEQRAEESNIAELSPGAVGAAGAGAGGAKAEHKASINSMMMERMNTDIYALKKQYARIKRRQQQQAMQLYVRTGEVTVVRTCHNRRTRACALGYRVSLRTTEVLHGSDRKLAC